MPINARFPLPKRVRFSLRTILLIMMLTVLLLPLLGVYFFRIYENELVRQTELELIAQSAALSASYRQSLRWINPDNARYGYVLQDSPLIAGNLSRSQSYARNLPQDTYYTPIAPTLDLVKPVYPPRPDARITPQISDDFARKAGVLMYPVLQDTQKVTLVGIRLLDMNGVVVGGREEIGLSLAHVPEVQQALRGQYVSVIRQRKSDEPPPPLYSISRGTNIRAFTAFPVMEGNRLQGVIYLSRTPKNILKHLYIVQDKLYLATSILLLVAVLLVLFVSSSISRPIRELIRQTERVTQGAQTQIEPLKNPVTHEVAQLSDSFASMSQALAERSDYIRRFATHVSHEFKTPLTSMQGALELLQEHIDSMDIPRRQRFMDNLLDDTQRLKNLVNRLLELARADALAPSGQTSTLPEILKPLRTRYQERGLHIVTESLPVQALSIAPDALETVLNNLLDNSLQHGANSVSLHTEVQEDTLILALHDNGKGISPANRERIFTPFFTTRRNSGGTGLGLEISMSLLKAYGGDIRLGNAAGGAEFIVRLPL